MFVRWSPSFMFLRIRLPLCLFISLLNERCSLPFLLFCACRGCDLRKKRQKRKKGDSLNIHPKRYVKSVLIFHNEPTPLQSGWDECWRSTTKVRGKTVAIVNKGILLVVMRVLFRFSSLVPPSTAKEIWSSMKLVAKEISRRSNFSSWRDLANIHAKDTVRSIPVLVATLLVFLAAYV